MSASFGYVTEPISLTVIKGQTWVQEMQWLAGESGAEVAVNISSIDMVCHIRRSVPSGDILFTLTNANGGIVYDSPTEGKYSLVLTGEQTQTLCARNTPEDLRIDILLTEDSGATYEPFLFGTIQALPWATRPWEVV